VNKQYTYTEYILLPNFLFIYFTKQILQNTTRFPIQTLQLIPKISFVQGCIFYN